MPQSSRITRRDFLRVTTRFGVLIALTLLADSAFAQQMIGQSLLTFAGNYVIAPLGIFAMVIALSGAFFRPDLARAGAYAAILCVVLYSIIRLAPQLTTALKN